MQITLSIQQIAFYVGIALLGVVLIQGFIPACRGLWYATVYTRKNIVSRRRILVPLVAGWAGLLLVLPTLCPIYDFASAWSMIPVVGGFCWLFILILIVFTPD